MKVGIDFGTTNSAVAALVDGVPRVIELAPGERVQRTVVHCSVDGHVRLGNAAFRAYVDEDLSGRFLRSLKSFLAQDVPGTTLAGRRYSYPDLVAAWLRFLVEGAERVTGERVTEVVVGRPVEFHADPDRNALAAERLVGAVADAGLTDVRLQLEPVAAAHRYELGLDRERLVLVGDFGGGTADFAILRASPARVRDRDRGSDVLATSGVAQAGDALDACFLDTFLMDAFGRGATWRKPRATSDEPWDHPLHRQILKLYALHLLRTPDLRRGLDRALDLVSDPRAVRRLQRLVFDDLGYPMAWAIEATKRALSDAPVATFRFDDFHAEDLDLVREVELGAYAAGSAELLDRYRGAVDLALQRAGLRADAVDDVFLTGGTSQLPFVRAVFADRFGPDRLRGADAFTSVAEGLALS